MKRIIALVAVCMIVPTLTGQEKFLAKSADGWARDLKSADAAQRRNAAFALGKMGGRGYVVIGDLRAAFAKEKDVKVRDAMVFAMGEMCRDTTAATGNVELEKLFITALTDAEPPVRRSAAFALGCLGTKSEAARQALDDALGDGTPSVRQNAAWALANFGSAALPSLARALRDADSLVKRDAAGALLQMEEADKVHELLKDLLPLCRDPNSEVRRAALNVLVRIVEPADKEAIPMLKWAIEDRDIENRRNAALTLSNIGGAETAVALPVLLEAAKNGDEDLRRQAVLAIRNIGPAASSGVNDLKTILADDKDAKTREYAAMALGGIGKASEPAINVLVNKVKDASEVRETRIECAMALARIGTVPSSSTVVPVLLDVLADRNQDTKVRERVIWALRVHGGNLRTMKGTKEAFTQIMDEPLNRENKMLRYDCAYMLGMIWQAKAPDATLGILHEFLKDKDVKIYKSTDTSVEGSGPEGGKSGSGKVKEVGAGDGRVMATDALKMMGPSRYSGHAGIMTQLRALADDAKTYEPLRKKAQELTK